MTRRESKIAAVVLAMIACAVAVLVGGMRLDDGAARIGPMRVLRTEGREWVTYFLANRLNVLDASGRRVAQQPLADLQLTEEPTDTEFSVDAQGRVQAWFFEDTAPRIVRCDLALERMRMEHCVQAMAGAQLKTNAISRAVHIAVDAARGRLFVADANGGVRAFSLDDGRVLAESPPGLLFFPNRVRVAGDVLMVADNDHRRLVWLDVAGERPSFALRRALPSAGHPQARPDRLKVTDFVYRAPSAGREEALWMLAVAQGQKNGDVLLFGPGSRPLARADRGGFGDPLMIDAFEDGILAADFAGVALYRIGDRGEYRGEFGDAAVRAEFDDARATIVRARWTTRAGWIIFVAAVVLGFALAFKYSERPVPAIAAVTFAAFDAEADASPVVLAPDPALTRRFSWLVGGAIAATCLAVLLPWWLVTSSRPDAPAIPPGWPLALAAVLVLGMAGVFMFLLRLMQRHVVASTDGLEVRWKDKPMGKAPWGELWASDQSLLVGHTTLPYRQPAALGRAAKWVFDEQLFTRHVLARIPPERRVATDKLMWLGLKRMPLWQQALLAIPLLAYVGWGISRLLR
jgi:hypothetical protein